jgi:hypothetical protein
MKPLSDDDLRGLLERRTAAVSLDHALRVQLIDAIHERVAGRRQNDRGWRKWRWLPAAAIFAALLLVVVLAYPRSLNSPVASAGPSSNPQGGGFILTAQELASAVAARTSIGAVVIADAQLSPDLRFDRCRATPRCYPRVISYTTPPLPVDMGGYAASDVPEGASVAAFRIQDGYVTYLGQTSVNGDEPWTVPEIPAIPGGSGLLIAVDGWLVQEAPHPCPSVLTALPGYPCGNETWITSESALPDSATASLRVQGGAYDAYAPDPQFRGGVYEPRQGLYLVRSVDCRLTSICSAPLWKVIGRVTTSATSPPLPSATPVSLVADWIFGYTYERPVSWSRSFPKDRAQWTGPAAYLSTAPLLSECAVVPEPSPVAPGASGAPCPWPLASLSPNGVLVTWYTLGTAQAIPTAGDALTIYNRTTFLQVDRVGCRDIGADERLIALLPPAAGYLNLGGQPASNIGVSACLRGPDLATSTAQFRAMIESLTPDASGPAPTP